MFNSIKKVISENNFDDIKLIGITCIEKGIAEFIPDMRYIYFEFGDSIIQFESIEQYSEVRIKLIDKIIYESDFEDVIPSVISIGRIGFTNSLAINKVANMILFNYEEGNPEIICDAVQFELNNEQLFFLDPQFIGFNIGGREQKELWLNNLVNGAIVYETVIKFE